MGGHCGVVIPSCHSASEAAQRVQRAEIRMTLFPIVPSPTPSPPRPRPIGRIGETRFLLASVSFAHRSRLILLGRPKTAPVHSLSPAIYPRFLGDRSVDRYQFRRESCQWKMEFFFFSFFFSRHKNSIRDTGIFIRVSNSLFFFFFMCVWLHRLVNRVA